MAAFQHQSVLLADTLAVLTPQDGEVYCDCTLGGGGHTEALLLAAPTCRVIGIDRDLEALAAAKARLERFGERVTLVHGAFGDVAELLAQAGQPKVHGLLADLGVSSWQLDSAQRGFSFSRPGPLDMRMDPSRGATALELIASLSADALANVIFELGEERHSRRIARAILRALAEGRLATTTDLAAVIAAEVPAAEQRRSKIHAATRTFQALRIAVNAELDQLQRLLTGFPDLLVAGGRCAIISFHSLEDRLVKQRFRDLAFASSLPPAFAAQEGERAAAVCELVTRKAIVAHDEEIAANPRARSARLRATRRTDAPNLPAQASFHR
ncbi:MAG: 16S rRNA (cytosine(1402)-N(4))-methyltransferase RsmH [Myxococcales bacterium]|nr:16S rRNA (cytosine(1402)-N(4))-methyltransferase RsmH [Myxococcales bacterium]